MNCASSLFFDPFANKIYDYANGMVDLRSLKVSLNFHLLIVDFISYQYIN